MENDEIRFLTQRCYNLIHAKRVSFNPVMKTYVALAIKRLKKLGANDIAKAIHGEFNQRWKYFAFPKWEGEVWSTRL